MKVNLFPCKIVTIIFWYMICLMCTAEIRDISEDKTLTFYLSFDKGLDADYAAGSRRHIIKGKDVFEQVDGIEGKGVVVSHPSSFLFYEIEKNVSADEGTISMWIKSIDWENRSWKFRIFWNSYPWLLYIRDNGSLALHVAYWDSKEHTVISRTAAYMCNWKPGEWHHVAATWSKKDAEISLFFDGERVSVQKDVPAGIFSFATDLFSIGLSKTWEKISDKPDTVIDEVRIFNKSLEPGQIKEIFMKYEDRRSLPENPIQQKGFSTSLPKTVVNRNEPKENLEKLLKLPEAYEPRNNIDSDGDGVDDATEMFVKMTSPFERDTSGDGVPDNISSHPLVHRELVGKSFPKAEVKEVNGALTFVVNGEPLASMWYNDWMPGYTPLLKRLGEVGMRLHLVDHNIFSPNERDSSLSDLDFHIEKVMRAIPDAYIIIRVRYMFMGYQWFAEHFPGDIVYYSDGEPMILSWPVVGPRYSFASQAVKAIIAQELVRLINHVRLSRWGDRVIGIKIDGGQTGEWSWWASDETSQKGIDHGPAMRKAFSRFLEKKYGSEENLKKAWRDNYASIKTPEIPHIKTRFSFDSYGTFDPDTQQHILDFWRCYNEVVTDMALYLAEVAKKASDGNWLVGFSISNSPEWCFRQGQKSIKRLMKSPYVDFLNQPVEYKYREPGGTTVMRSVFSSEKMHKVVWFGEMDMRTHLSKSGWPSEPKDVSETVEVLKRTAGKFLVMGMPGYWLSFAHNWHDAPEIFSMHKKIQKIGEVCPFIDRNSESEIALVYDEESLFLRNLFVHTYTDIQYALDYVGAPYDYYELDDILSLPEKDIKKYKMVIFIHIQSLTNSERNLIRERILKNNITAVWMGVPGLINTDISPAKNIRYMEDITGFSFSSGQYRGMITITSEGAKTLGLAEGTSITGEFYSKNNQIPTRYHTFFSVDNADEVWGKFDNGSPAFALKNMNKWKSIYCSATLISPEILKALATFAGVHSYISSQDALYKNNSLLVIHTSTPGKKSITLKKKMDVYDLWEEKWIAFNTSSFSFEAVKNTTYLFYTGKKEIFEKSWKEAEKRFNQRNLDRRNKITQMENKSANLNDTQVKYYLDNDGYVKDFLFLGPFLLGARDVRRNLETLPDFLISHGGEKKIMPKEGDSIIDSEGNVKTWRIIHSQKRQNFGSDFGILSGEESVYYLAFYIDSADEQQVILKTSLIDDDLKVWVNDEGRGNRLEFSNGVFFNLRKGRNRILCKMHNHGGPTYFMLQILDRNGKPLVSEVKFTPSQ